MSRNRVSNWRVNHKYTGNIISRVRSGLLADVICKNVCLSIYLVVVVAIDRLRRKHRIFFFCLGCRALVLGRSVFPKNDSTMVYDIKPEVFHCCGSIPHVFADIFTL